MRITKALALLFCLMAIPTIVGCGPVKEDPTKREGFKDTSDPTNIGNLGMPTDVKGAGAPGEEQK
jgi:hypothetical protein